MQFNLNNSILDNMNNANAGKSINVILTRVASNNNAIGEILVTTDNKNIIIRQELDRSFKRRRRLNLRTDVMN